MIVGREREQMRAKRMKIEQLAVETLLPYANNSRTHSAAQVQQIAASITEFGFTNPILIDETCNVIAGHGRILAAQSIGLADVPCIRLTALSDAQKRAYIIADNQLALNAGWDIDKLKFEVEHLNAVDFDIDLLGFDSTFIDSLLTPEPSAADVDEVPEVLADAVSVAGDVWILGAHRVMCGDSTVVDDVQRLTLGARVALLHADPPYGMGKAKDGVVNDNASAYIWGNAPDLWRLWWVGGLADSEPLRIRNEITWDKNDVAGMRSAALTQFPTASERCLYFQLGGKGGNFFNNAHAVMRDVWTFSRVRGEERHGHATPKPVGLVERVMQTSLPFGGLCLEPFGGSGSTLMGAETTGRVCYAMEITPAYVDVIVKRWQAYTGRDAVNETTFKTFTQTAAGE